MKIDLSEVRGQEAAKRVAEIALCGDHQLTIVERIRGCGAALADAIYALAEAVPLSDWALVRTTACPCGRDDRECRCEMDAVVGHWRRAVLGRGRRPRVIVLIYPSTAGELRSPRGEKTEAVAARIREHWERPRRCLEHDPRSDQLHRQIREDLDMDQDDLMDVTRVALTIAMIDGAGAVRPSDLAEALTTSEAGWRDRLNRLEIRR